MKKVKIMLAVIGGLLAFYLVTSPYITVYQMKSAIANHDIEAFSKHVEYPSIRQNLKDQMKAMFTKKTNESKDNPFATMGASFAGMMVDKIIDTYVTPSSITQLMSGEKPKLGLGNNNVESNNPSRKPLADASMSYESIDKFVVKVKNTDGGEGRFILRRRGINWKLTEIIIPL